MENVHTSDIVKPKREKISRNMRMIVYSYLPLISIRKGGIYRISKLDRAKFLQRDQERSLKMNSRKLK